MNTKVQISLLRTVRTVRSRQIAPRASSPRSRFASRGGGNDDDADGSARARAVLLVATLALTCESASAIRPAGWRPSGTHGPTTDADSGSPAAVGSVDDAASTAEASSEPQPEPIPAPASGTPVASDAAPEIAMPARYDDAGFAEVGGDAASLRRTPPARMRDARLSPRQ